MSNEHEELLQKAYKFFNERDIDSILELMSKDVVWPNGWEGGFVKGHDEVRDYWSRQWKELSPNVQPIGFAKLSTNVIEVNVQQVVRDLSGTLLAEGIVKHVYTFEDDLIKKMEIEKI
jgi:hypothetical protein